MNPLLMPFWEGNDVLLESLLPVGEPDGVCAPMRLLYHADEIVSVMSATQEITYQPGKDYALADGCLAIPAGSSIPVMAYGDYYLSEEDPGKCFMHSDGGYIRFSEGSYFHEKQMVVSYRHQDAWTGSVPKDRSHLLPRTMDMLRSGTELNLLIFGDSISTGSNASGKFQVPPYQKPWYDLMVEGLQDAYHTDGITLKNISVGGKISAWGRETAEENGVHQQPDLCVIAFGMNDGSGRIPVADYIENTCAIMDAIRAAKPQCEFVLVATTLANHEVKGFLGNQADYLPALLALECEGVCVADMTTFHQELLRRKAFRDMTGNNVNHPNDFLSRAYAQVLLRTLGAL